MSDASDPQKLLKTQRREVISVGALSEGSHYRKEQTTQRMHHEQFTKLHSSRI